jgi:hypothetical protein
MVNLPSRKPGKFSKPLLAKAWHELLAKRTFRLHFAQW